MAFGWLHMVEGLALAVFCIAGWLVLDRARRKAAEFARQNRALIGELERVDDRVWELAASEALHRSLVETLGDLVVRRAGDGRILYANAGYAGLLARAPESLRGLSLQPHVLAATGVQTGPNGSLIQDELIALPSGEQRWISWIETSVALDGDPMARQRVGRDVTGRVATERLLDEARARAESASEAKSRFLATVSHEFRTPLNGILGTADLLGDTRLDPEQRAYLKALQTSGRALLGLVDEILDLTRVEAGKLELMPAPFDPARLAEDVAELMAPRAHAKGLDIAAFVAAGMPAKLVGDEERIRQILVNLVGNAVKFTQSGGVALRVAHQPETGLSITVEDTGPGVAPERQEAIFLEFEQEDASTNRAHGGTGLGLAIVRRLADAMGGAVALASAPGQGARFTVTLPLPVAEQSALATLPLQGRRIAIVAEGRFTAEAMAEAARSAGAEVRLSGDWAGIATAGWTAGAKQAAKGPDSVIIDYALGAEPAQAILHAARAAGVREALVLISPQERRALGRPTDAGFSGHLVKPVRARSLLDRLAGQTRVAEAVMADAAPQGAAGVRVLLAEDNEINAMIATRMLERAGAQVIWAQDGAVALREATSGLAEGAGFDLILMDVRMPEDGWAGRDPRHPRRRGRVGPSEAHTHSRSQCQCRRGGCRRGSGSRHE